jgi:uncharacterized membrane protein YbhN (UPF0104 family)
VSALRRHARRVVPVLVSVGALTFLFVSVDFQKLAEALSWKIALTLVPAFLVYGAVTLAIEAISLMRLVPSHAPRFGLATAARIKCASYILGIVNYALGVAALSVLLQRRATIRLAEAASVVLLISGVDMLVVLSLASLGLAAAQAETPLLWIALLTVGAVGFFGGMALLHTPASLGPLERIRSLAFFEALRSTPTRRIAEVIALRALFASSFIGLAGAIFLSFGLSPQPGELIVGILVVAVVAALPIAPAGLGTGNVAFVNVFQGLAPYETLLAVSLVMSAGMIALRVAMGLVFAREYTREVLEESHEVLEESREGES